MPEQVAGFFKCGVVGEFVNINTAVGQNALLAVDVADTGGGGNYAFESLWGVRYTRHTPSQEARSDRIAGPRGIDAGFGNPLLYPNLEQFSKRSLSLWAYVSRVAISKNGCDVAFFLLYYIRQED